MFLGADLQIAEADFVGGCDEMIGLEWSILSYLFYYLFYFFLVASFFVDILPPHV